MVCHGDDVICGGTLGHGNLCLLQCTGYFILPRGIVIKDQR